MDSNLSDLLRAAITALADHADAVRELADAVRDHAAATAGEEKRESETLED